MTRTTTITLTEQEKRYLMEAAFLPTQLSDIVIAHLQNSRRTAIGLTSAQAEEFRAAFTERLAQGGFDGQYSLTSEGVLLERLIDKFFVE